MDQPPLRSNRKVYPAGLAANPIGEEVDAKNEYVLGVRIDRVFHLPARAVHRDPSGAPAGRLPRMQSGVSSYSEMGHLLPFAGGAGMTDDDRSRAVC